MPRYTLGISAFYHDAAACLVRDGEIVAAVEEERLTRVKHDRGFPDRSIEACLGEAGITPAELDAVVFYEKTFPKLERQLLSWIGAFPRSFSSFVRSMSRYLDGRLDMRRWLERRLGTRGEILFAEHHLSHAAFSFYTSPFDAAHVLVVDGVGEWATTSLWYADAQGIAPRREIHFPDSLGLFYSIVTAHLGFRVNEDEYKVMGLASYGRDTHAEQMAELLPFEGEAAFRLETRLIDLAGKTSMTTPALERLLGPARPPGSAIEPRHEDIARSAQARLELALERIAATLPPGEPLCLAGGVALNGAANARLAASRPIHVPFAPGDSGGAIGAALLGGIALGSPRPSKPPSPYLGPAHDDEEMRSAVRETGLRCTPLQELGGLDFVAGELEKGRIVGFFDGRSEFGPRALGSRSIVADPRSAHMRDVINARVKHREPFRPFAPAILEERADEYFDLRAPVPWMTQISPVRPEVRDRIAAVVHVDGTGRLQTVNRLAAPNFHALIEAFARRTGIPVLLNTSFNVAGEPIVCSPLDACRCFISAGLDGMVLGTLWVEAGMP
jgi:carbamoyltransferase